MERKVFYTLVHKRCFVGIEQVEGFEFTIKDSRFYGYINKECGKAYIIDPETGRSIYDYPVFDECQGINAVKNTIDMFMEDKCVLEAFERKKDTEKYGLMQEIFKSFLHGQELEEKMRTGKKISQMKL